MATASQRPFVTVVQHEQVEGLGSIAEALDEAGVGVRYVRASVGDPVPYDLGEASGLVVMGGPMGVYDAPRYPSLRDEMRLIEDALRKESPILGICLGSQLLAHVLGAEVRPAGRKEIGWFDVTLSGEAASDPLWAGIERRFPAFHWHGDAFHLPPGAIHLASSDLTACQAFRHGSACGLLFHLEVTTGIVRDMVRTWPDELRDANLSGQAIIGAADQFLPRMREVAHRFFRGWTKAINAG